MLKPHYIMSTLSLSLELVYVIICRKYFMGWVFFTNSLNDNKWQSKISVGFSMTSKTVSIFNIKNQEFFYFISLLKKLHCRGCGFHVKALKPISTPESFNRYGTVWYVFFCSQNIFLVHVKKYFLRTKENVLRTSALTCKGLIR